jgi:integrator complex subunit 2
MILILLQVRITEWIYQQLCQCTAPIHSVIPSLIEAFVTSIIVPAARGDCTNEPIPEEQLLVVFEDPFSLRASGAGQVDDVKNSTFMTHILLVYYLLLYEDTLLSNMASVGKYFEAFLFYFMTFGGLKCIY